MEFKKGSDKLNIIEYTIKTHAPSRSGKGTAKLRRVWSLIFADLNAN
jgi:hypothetical protein